MLPIASRFDEAGLKAVDLTARDHFDIKAMRVGGPVRQEACPVSFDKQGDENASRTGFGALAREARIRFSATALRITSAEAFVRNADTLERALDSRQRE